MYVFTAKLKRHGAADAATSLFSPSVSDSLHGETGPDGEPRIQRVTVVIKKSEAIKGVLLQVARALCTKDSLTKRSRHDADCRNEVADIYLRENTYTY